VVLSSDQLQAASSPDVVGTGLAEGETAHAEPDWPATADWRSNSFLPQAALRLCFIPASLPDKVGINCVSK